jgi:hypothetical protein
MTNEPDQALTNQINMQIEHILKLIDDALSKGFRPIARDHLPSAALTGVNQWRSEIVRQGGEKESDLAYSFHLSKQPIGDVVRIERKQAGPEVVEYHTLLAMSVWVRPEPGTLAPAGVAIEDYNRIARSLFNVETAFQPRPAAPFEQGLAVSTAPMRDIYGMPSWSDRVDAGSRKGYLHFVFYHRNSTQSVGLAVGGPWFDDEFRRKNR